MTQQQHQRQTSSASGLPWLALVVVAFLGGGRASASLEPTWLKVVERPSFAGMGPAVREQLTQAQDVLEGDIAARRLRGKALGQAYGELGQLYLAYDLVGAAEPCLENARLLDPETFRWPYLLGALLQNEGRLGDAETRYREALEHFPEDHPALVRLGNVLLAADRPDEARQVFARALRVQGASAAALAGLGKAAALLGEPGGAVERFRAALALQPEATSLHYPLAIALRELGELESAREELRLRGSVDPHFADPLAQELVGFATGAGVHLVLGNRAMRQGSTEAAIRRFRQALEIDPRSLAAHRALGTALGRQGDSEGAIRHYSAGLALDPGNANLHYNLGTLLADQGQDEQAVRHFRAALAQIPDHANARFNLATALGRLGRFAAAADEYQLLWEQEPEDFSTRFYLAQAFLKLGRHKAAEDHLLALVAEEPERVRVHLGLARARRGAGRAAQAQASYRRALNLLAAEVAVAEPASATEGGASLSAADRRELALATRLELADLLAEVGNVEEAIRLCREALDLAPERVELERRLAALLARAGRYGEAVEAYVRVVDQDPGSSAGYFGLTMARLLDGRESEAARGLEQALARLPGQSQLVHLQARLLATSTETALRDGGRALELVRGLIAVERRPEYAETLAMALAELGRFEEAGAWQERLLQAARAGGAAQEFLRGLEVRLAAYREGLPCRQPWLDSGASKPKI